MHNIILTAVLLILGSVSVSAQFYTITKETEIHPEKKKKTVPDTLQRCLVAFESCKRAENDSIEATSPTKGCKGQSDQKSYNKTSPKMEPTKEVWAESKTLPALTIPNLYQEIIRNDIKHPKIVLAQAILETGWFRSPFCRNRHNLFGLTNPKTGKYYEFNHWMESVRAYYTKVQYRYSQKNRINSSDVDYLKWLRDIGYAEDPRYVRELIKVMQNYL